MCAFLFRCGSPFGRVQSAGFWMLWLGPATTVALMLENAKGQ